MTLPLRRLLPALALLALVFSILLQPPALAADPPAGTAAEVAAGVEKAAQEHAEGGLPQLNPETYPTQIFWLAVTFFLLLFLMSRVALPKVAEVLEARQEKITDDLEQAATLKGQAEAVLQAYEKSLVDARQHAQQLIAQVNAQADADAAKAQADLAARLAEEGRTREANIEAAKRTALTNIRFVAVDAAQAAVGRLLGEAPSNPAAEAAVNDVLAGLQGPPAAAREGV